MGAMPFSNLFSSRKDAGGLSGLVNFGAEDKLRIVDEIEQQIRKIHLPFDPVKELHVLTDDLFHHGQYRFE